MHLTEGEHLQEDLCRSILLHLPKEAPKRMKPWKETLKLVARSPILILAEEEREEALDMVDLGLLTDDQLKAKLLQYGFKSGPIVASTRALYIKKLHRLMEPPALASLQRVNGIADAGWHSDSEVEADEVYKESEPELHPEIVPQMETETSKITSREPVTDVLTEMFPNTVKTPTGIYTTKRL